MKQNPDDSEALRYIPGLDSIRGVAVLMVVGFHAFYEAGYVGEPSTLATRFVKWAVLGKLGVALFFVLSGFLITSILLTTREKTSYYKNFYVRRALRILPLYGVVLAILFDTHMISGRFLVICLAFVANYGEHFGAKGIEYGVLWSLAVEEQFYLVWPTIVRHLKSETLIKVSVGGIVASLGFRLVESLLGRQSYYSTPGNIDCLLVGALLAIWIKTGSVNKGNIRNLYLKSGMAGVILAGPYLWFTSIDYSHMHIRASLCFAFEPVVPILFFVAAVFWAVDAAWRNEVKKGRVQRVLSFFGYISYGLYLIHQMVFHLYDSRMPGTVLGGFHSNFLLVVARFGIVLAVSTGIAFLSRRFFEQPILGFKSLLAPYRVKNKQMV